METDTLSLKLHIFVDKKKNRVLFAEAGKDFVDFIFHILTLPLGAVARILSDTSNLGSIDTLREGLKNLDTICIGSRGKQYLLDVKAPCYASKLSHPLPEASFSEPHTLYRCSKSGTYVEKTCIYNPTYRCCSALPFPASLKDVSGSVEGYVNGSVKFMVLDDLTVRASAATAAFSILDVFSIKDIRAIEKREVTFGTNEGVKLLKDSLSSKTVLSDVFLAGGAVVKEEN